MSASDVTAYGAGSSGATYFTAGTLCAVLLLRGLGRDRLLALIGPVIAAVMWALNNDGHGIMFLAGAGLGLILTSVFAVVRIPTPMLSIATARTAPAGITVLATEDQHIEERTALQGEPVERCPQL